MGDAVTAWGFGSDERDTTLDADFMAKVVMPNVDGFVTDPRPDTSE